MIIGGIDNIFTPVNAISVGIRLIGMKLSEVVGLEASYKINWF